jgi:hypothetical protein
MSDYIHSLVLIDCEALENVIEHVLDLAANEAEDHDHDDCDQQHDQGVFDQALTFLAFLQLTYQHLQHFTTPLSNIGLNKLTVYSLGNSNLIIQP